MYNKDGSLDDEDNSSRFLTDLAICLFSFNALKPFLSKKNQEKYGRALQSLYHEIKMEIEGGKSIKEDKKSHELNFLTRLFHIFEELEAVSI